MPDNQEQIESQLCAYVDDALDPKDQAEIERHLEANPQHRRLLDDLKVGRDLLRGLPRETAPAELTESFTGQLERSALLDGMGSPEPERRMRIHRLPQIAAAAAIVMLASGLGAVVYFAMPGGRPVVASTQGVPDVSHVAARPSAEAALRDSVGEARSGKKDENPVPPVDHLVAGGRGDKEGAAFKEADSLKLEAVAKDVSNNQQVQELLFGKAGSDAAATQPAPREAIVMVVNSRDPNETRKQLAEYFTTNNIAWSPAPPTNPAKSDKPAGDTAGEFAAGAAATNQAEAAPQINAALAKPTANSKVDSTASAEGQPTNEPGYVAPPQPVAPSAPAAAPAAVAQAAPAAQAPLPTRTGGQASVQLGAAVAQNYNQQDQDAGGLYVARNVSRRQAVELGNNLNRAGGEQAALFANAFESNHVAPVRDPAGAWSNDSKDARHRMFFQAAQGNLDQAASQGRLAAKGAEGPGTPATQPQELVAQGTASSADKADAQQFQRQVRQAPVAAAAEPQERRELQLQKSAPEARSYAKHSEGTADEAPPPYALAPEQGKQKVAAPTTAPANIEEAVDAPQNGPATDNPVDLVIVVQNGTKEPVLTLTPSPASQPAEQSAPAK